LLDVLLAKVSAQLVLPWGILSVTVINAAAGVALDRIDRGERATIRSVYGAILRRFWPLLGASLLVLLLLLLVIVAFAALPVGLSFVTDQRWVPYLALAGFPVAIWLGIRFAFVPYVVMLEGTGVREALRRSTALVRGTWWRTAIVLGLLYVIAVSVSTVIGWVLIFTTSLPPELLNVIGSALYGLILPFIAISACLLYFDRVERANTEGLTPPRGWPWQDRHPKSDVRLSADGLHDAGGAHRDPSGGS
jgi:hypothetical protein